MPPKIRDLKKMLLAAHFALDSKRGKGSHVSYIHPGIKPVVIPHHDNDDALPYLIRQVNRAIQLANFIDHEK